MEWRDSYSDSPDPGSGGMGRPGGDWRGIRPRFDNPLTWSLDLFRFQGILVRLHLFFLIFVVVQLLRAMAGAEEDAEATSLDMLTTAVVMAALFVVVMLHEFGHCFACRKSGGEANEILMWPLGGLAYCMPARSARAHFLTTAGGPLVNIVICSVLAPVLYMMTGVFWEVALPNPLYIANGFMYLAVSDSWLTTILYAIHGVSFLLLLFNLLPMFPLDGGRLVQAALWPRMGYANSMRLSVRIGFIGAILLAIFGMVANQWMLVGIAVFGGITCYITGKQLEYTEALMNYEGGEVESYAQGLTSEWSASDPADDDVATATRAERREAKAAEREAEEAERVDAILEKISREGMDSLSRSERRLLEKMTEKKRGEGSS